MGDKYNGWSNYETWNAALWLDNDYGAYSAWHERAQELVDEHGKPSDGEYNDAVTELADEMEAAAEEQFPELLGMASDLLRSAFDAIDWREIADHYIADCDAPESDDTGDDKPDKPDEPDEPALPALLREQAG